MIRGEPAKATPGISLVLRLTSKFKVGHLFVAKGSIIERRKVREDLMSYVFDRPLILVAENEVRFTAIA
jgi:hypothetical protein